ncbi:hypothetical protein Pmani_023541 [Petrolisthes manimaculis]|uniref:PDEase domain-containing protein n=1 Tax=Petrolisthes manimaculis TaxID=1843537 RepID=A0AAE1PBR7_9EUCA|nr:hypothetical protein Pmani_023541 [Petrolisthes manimaculis]
MGSAVTKGSRGTNKTIFIKVGNNVQKVTFSSGCSSREVHDQLAAVCSLPRGSTVLLKDKHGAHITVSPAMKKNSAQDAFILDTQTFRQKGGGGGDRDDTVTNTVAAVAAQLQRVFKIEELRADFGARICSLEKRLENSKRVIEIEKFKYEIADIRDAFLTHNKTRHIDFSRLRPAVTLPATFFSPGTVREHVITLQREPPPYTKYTLTGETVDHLRAPTFDMWQWEPNEMLSLIEHMYADLGIMEEFCISPPVLRNFLVSVQENYRNNPFHNFRHCFSVTQMMYGLINLCRLQDKLPRKDLGVLITSCVCHDLDHPGYNNWYQINARTELAVRYNDTSPLENHHCAVGFRVLANPECNIFSGVPDDVFKELRAVGSGGGGELRVES